MPATTLPVSDGRGVWWAGGVTSTASDETRSDVPADPAEDLSAYIAASPSPYHAAQEALLRLVTRGGWQEVSETDAWAPVERGAVVRRGALVAWWWPESAPAHVPLRVVGAHTDSPNLRVKPRPDTGRAGWRQLGVEVYGGPLLNSWLDRDLGLSGSVSVHDPAGPTEVLFRTDEPIARLPQLAIHLDREIYEKGVDLDRQRHLAPVWGLGTPEPGGFSHWLAAQVGTAPDDVLGWELMFHDLTPPAVIGVDRSLLAAPRLDNQASCWAGVEALLAAAGTADTPVVLCLFDHEEVGSVSSAGAGGDVLPGILERLVAVRGGGDDELRRSLAGSACASADMAHATHPNYSERHEPEHWIEAGGGPVLKINSQSRYATDAKAAGIAAAAARQAEVPLQRYVNRTDLPCGSTIGPVTAARLGMTTFDVGAPQLSMHSARELCAVADLDPYVRFLAAFCSP
jgi:aspartyl aminopeptidase